MKKEHILICFLLCSAKAQGAYLVSRDVPPKEDFLLIEDYFSSLKRCDTLHVKQLLQRAPWLTLVSMRDILPESRANETDLIIAIKGNCEDLTNLLLRYGADSSMPDAEGKSPLELAAEGGNTDIVRMLLMRRSDEDRLERETHLALMAAIQRGYEDVVRALLPVVTKVDAESDDSTPLMLALSGGNDNIVDLLLQAGADATKGFPLLFAVQQRKENLVKKLLDAGSSAEQKDNDETTALMVAVSKGSEVIADLLLKHGADINVQRWRDGFTPLMIAVTKWDAPMVDLLLRNGADITLKDKNDETALSLATKQRRKTIINLLEEAQSIDHLVNAGGEAWNSPQGKEFSHVLYSYKNDDPLLQLLVQRAIALLKKHETNTNSIQYRNAARILYTLARRIAQDYIKTLGTKTSLSHGIKVLPHELEVAVFVASYNSSLVNLLITNSGGQDESFAHIVEENIDRLISKKS